MHAQSDRVGALLQIRVRKYFQVKVENANSPRGLQQRPSLEVWIWYVYDHLIFILFTPDKLDPSVA